ncbi:uncharacterized protein LOC131250672 [Magnolia sinica]|uniref:uncharacterized protein LOC131250672 n=1 Tax=Magnolia sinica TaxID=86752 RepID=UPI002659EA87|nr:uncharacterized protein LOC131250672 [Magnolia sinica]
MINFLSKLKAVKTQLKCWNREEFGNIFTVVKEADQRLSFLEEKLQQYEEPVLESDPLHCQIHDARTSLSRLERMEETFWKQKAWNNWLEEGNRNTGFFHVLAIERVRRAVITAIQLHSGRIVESQEDIKIEVARYFHRLFSAGEVDQGEDLLSSIPSLVSAEDNTNLLAKPTIQEVHHAVLSIPRDGAAGPDGFFAAFFVGCWDIVGQDLLNATIFLVIACRLRKLLPSLISQEQGAFVQGRAISESIALSQELLRELNRKVKGGNIAIKLDMEKAYDRVD